MNRFIDSQDYRPTFSWKEYTATGNTYTANNGGLHLYSVRLDEESFIKSVYCDVEWALTDEFKSFIYEAIALRDWKEEFNSEALLKAKKKARKFMDKLEFTSNYECEFEHDCYEGTWLKSIHPNGALNDLIDKFVLKLYNLFPGNIYRENTILPYRQPENETVAGYIEGIKKLGAKGVWLIRKGGQLTIQSSINKYLNYAISKDGKVVGTNFYIVTRKEYPQQNYHPCQCSNCIQGVITKPIQKDSTHCWIQACPVCGVYENDEQALVGFSYMHRDFRFGWAKPNDVETTILWQSVKPKESGYHAFIEMNQTYGTSPYSNNDKTNPDLIANHLSGYMKNTFKGVNVISLTLIDMPEYGGSNSLTFQLIRNRKHYKLELNSRFYFNPILPKFSNDDEAREYVLANAYDYATGNLK